MPKTRLVAARLGCGRIGVVETPMPELKKGSVLVQVQNSLISPGTELGGGWRALNQERESSQVYEKPRPFGYSNAGIVVEVGAEVQQFAAGDRIACIGAGYAQHTNYAVVPQNLCVALPANVSFEQGAYAMLSATALYALRRGDFDFGDYVGVIGLGIIGQIAAQLLRQAGNYVIGWEMISKRIQIAHSWGIHDTAHVGEEDELEKTQSFTKGMGLDGAVLAFAGEGSEVIQKLEKAVKRSPDTHPMGTVVIVGNISFQFKATTTNLDLRRSSRTGPGYHDESWEFGSEYPPVFIRWSTHANLELCMRFISEGRLNVDCLTTHRVALQDMEKGIGAIIESPDDILGVIVETNC